jgi:hypothetical protein
MYEKWWLKNLYELHLKFPDDIICYRAFDILTQGMEIRPYAEWIKNYKRGTDRRFFVLPTNGSGSLFPPGSFSSEIFDVESFMKICPYEDDVWFRAASMLKGVYCRRVFSANEDFDEIPNTQSVSLSKINHGAQTLSDTQIKAVFNHFNLLKLPFS